MKEELGGGRQWFCAINLGRLTRICILATEVYTGLSRGEVNWRRSPKACSGANMKRDVLSVPN